MYTLFPCFCQENGIHHSFFCSVTSGSGDRPRKEGCHGGGVYSFFPLLVLVLEQGLQSLSPGVLTLLLTDPGMAQSAVGAIDFSEP